MKKLIILSLILVSTAAWGQSFDSVVDFDTELSTLSDKAFVTDVIQSGQVVILEGLLGDVRVDESSLGGTSVWASLVGGAWIGTQEVRAYGCQIRFAGEEWVERFQPQSDDAPDIIPHGSRLLVACVVIGYDASTNMPLAEMVDYRILN